MEYSVWERVREGLSLWLGSTGMKASSSSGLPSWGDSHQTPMKYAIASTSAALAPLVLLDNQAYGNYWVQKYMPQWVQQRFPSVVVPMLAAKVLETQFFEEAADHA